MQASIDEAIRKRAGYLTVHLGDDCRRRIQTHHLLERNDAAAAEIAPEQFERRSTLGVLRLANKNGWQFQTRLALAHDLSARFGPVDERAATAATQHRRLCAE